jgi:drug/metabolite transporter (DMT)-like permease
MQNSIAHSNRIDFLCRRLPLYLVPTVGEFLALLTAFLWAVSVVLYRKSVGFVTPFALNLFKSCVSFLLLAITAVMLGQAQFAAIPSKHLLIMVLSGALGNGVSDTLLFMGLQRVGASRMALVDCLYSPFVILFSLLMLEETLTIATAIGGGLILASVVLSSQRSFGESITRQQFWIGCTLGILAMATVAFAIVLVKPLLDIYPLTWLNTIRMAGGIGILLLSLPFHPNRQSIYKAFKPQSAWKWIVPATFMGSYLSVITWVAGFKYSQAGIAALLNQTSTVFIVIFAAMFLKEPITRLKLLAVAMAFAGIAVILF